MKSTSLGNIESTPKKKKEERWCRRCGLSCTTMYCSPNCADKAQRLIRAYNRIYGKYRDMRKGL